ncbi:MAG: hypothetical protein FWD23_07645 [Oscillospiraceae bacterium]|nr:hypothetical protein [Oscillospiraceae bacterium]
MVKMFKFISFVLILSLVFAFGTVFGTIMEDSPLAGGMVTDNGSSANSFIPESKPVPPPFAQDTIAGDEPAEEAADDELTEGESEAADDELAEDGLADDVFADDGPAEVLAEAPREQQNAKFNPKTGDGTMLFVILSAVSLAVSATGSYFAKSSKRAG